ncbi:MAG: OmpA family protein, partial [Candidatus Palauibacterales bacterium]|nr:OmpA family protein [Candidatus Palauibacterales bacterium]
MRSSRHARRSSRPAFLVLLSVLGLGLAPTVVLPASAHAQIFKRLKHAAKDALVNETKNQVDRIISNAVKCVFDDPLCAQKAKDSGQDVVFTDDQGNVLTDDEGKPVTDAGQAADVAAASGDETLAPNTGVWTNYDFVPGEQVLFYDDYSQDHVGDFPRHLTFLKGNWELVEWRGRRLLRNTGPRASAIEVPLPDTLPSRFTIEFDVYFTHENQQLVVGTEPPPSRGDRYDRIPGNVFQVAVVQGTGIRSNTRGGVESLNNTEAVGQKIVPFRIMVDGSYAKVYVGSHRVANVPNAEIHRGTSLYIEDSYFADDKHPMYLGPIRVAAGGRDLYDVLAEKGRVATHGILFAVNSSVLRPESTPTLEEIARMLHAHPDLRLSIEGHTDSTGDADYNLAL